ncbi:Uncharacterised protein [Kingella potus]|uniref:GNAT family N-acetyltransferase n=1 Tax=Kingella potus TaxID=265175 RepID=A0A377QYW7_9NEIS|nr:hypothetical protein [Kingella potus]STR00069.1 Uncharacterised protein [Kingella potus]
MNKLTTRTEAPQNLSAAQTAALYALYARYYGGTSPELFRRDLAEKDHILLLEDESGQTRGFTTLKTIPFSHQGQSGRALFSGDTIIDHRYWGEQTLPLAWCALAGRLKAQQPDTPLHWLLIVKGDRTYRYLNVFSKAYYPNRRTPTPPDIQRLIDHLAAARFGTHYHPDTGLVRYPQSQGHLKSEWLNGKTAANPEAAYFRSRNPGHAQGDELVCLTLLAPENLRSFALHGFLAGLEQGPLA